MTSGPILTDGIISLRAPDDADLDGIDEGLRDPDVIHWLGRPPGSASEILELNRRRAADGSPTFAIRDGDDSFVGLAWINRSATDAASASIGYWLLAGARGNGAATRAVRLLVDHALRDLGLRRVVLVTDVANEASRRVAERAGFEQTATRPAGADIDGRSSDVAVYSIPLGDR